MDYLNGRILAMLEAAKAEVVAGNQKIADLARGEGAVRVATDSLTARVEAFDAAYAAVKSRSTAHEAKLRELGSLEEQQRAARDLLRKQESELSSLGDPLSKHAELRLELSLHGRQRSKALKDQCAQLSESSDGLIRATLSMGTGFGVAQSKLKALITGSNVRGTKIDVLFEQLPEELDPVATWESVLAELESLVLLEPDSEIRSEQFPVIARLGIGVPDLKKIAPRVTPDGWLDLSLALVADHPVFEYRSKEDVYIPFSAASAGQQASALLTTLLSQDGTPLVIDQPEDDLDSNTVQQIVSKIWASKRRRQLIFSSHNANLVVNGDADLVLVCAYTSAGDQSAGHIKLEGAIDIDEVRSEITSVMEGGERAFKLRKEKYGF